MAMSRAQLEKQMADKPKQQMTDEERKRLLGTGAASRAAEAKMTAKERMQKALEEAQKARRGYACGGPVKKMKTGGKVRGCGVARRGVRKAKIR